MTRDGHYRFNPTSAIDIQVQRQWMLTKSYMTRALTWQLGDRKSHSLIVLSNEPEINVSSTGDMERDVTLIKKQKRTNGNHMNF